MCFSKMSSFSRQRLFLKITGLIAICVVRPPSRAADKGGRGPSLSNSQPISKKNVFFEMSRPTEIWETVSQRTESVTTDADKAVSVLPENCAEDPDKEVVPALQDKLDAMELDFVNILVLSSSRCSCRFAFYKASLPFARSYILKIRRRAQTAAIKTSIATKMRCLVDDCDHFFFLVEATHGENVAEKLLFSQLLSMACERPTDFGAPQWLQNENNDFHQLM